MDFSVIATVDEKSGILLPNFMHDTFTHLTRTIEGECEENAVIMGRKTWETCKRSLRGRRNVVLSRDPFARLDLHLPASVLVSHTLDKALQILHQYDYIQTAFV